jgi:hypothetical protein
VRTFLGLLLASAIVFILDAGVRGAEPSEPKAIIEKALAAAGGREKLARGKAITWKGRARSEDASATLEYTDTWIYQFPGRARYEHQELTGFKRAIVSVLNGDMAWVSLLGRVEEMDPAWITEYQERTHAARVATLTPLADPAFTLDALGEKQQDGKTLVGVRVSFKGKRDVSLYFDKETNLLRIVENRHKNPDQGGSEHVEEVLYGEYREFDGVKRPTRATHKRDGKVTGEGEMSDYKVLERVEEEWFGKPR